MVEPFVGTPLAWSFVEPVDRCHRTDANSRDAWGTTRSDGVGDIVFGDERAIEQRLLTSCAGFAGLNKRGHFVRGLLRIDGERLRHDVLQIARVDCRAAAVLPRQRATLYTYTIL